MHNNENRRSLKQSIKKRYKESKCRQTGEGLRKGWKKNKITFPKQRIK